MDRLVVTDLDALVAVEAIERVASRTVRERLDLGARAGAVVDDHRLFVHFDANGDVLFRLDFEPLAVVELDDLVVGDGLAVAVLAFEPKQRAVLVVAERLDLRARQGLIVEVVGMAVDVDGDGRVRDASSRIARSEIAPS